MSELKGFYIVHPIGVGIEYFTGKTRITPWGRTPCFTDLVQNAKLYTSLKSARNKLLNLNRDGFKCRLIKENGEAVE